MMRHAYCTGGTKRHWIAEPEMPRFTRSMKIKCNAALYDCCKKGTAYFPDTDYELDPEDTDVEELKPYEKMGHSDNLKDYAAIMPNEQVWPEFMASLKKRPKDPESKAWAARWGKAVQIQCATTTEKANIIKRAHAGEQEVLTTLTSLGMVPLSFDPSTAPSKVDDIIKALTKPSKKTMLAMRKVRKYPLLDDIGPFVVHVEKESCAEISRKKRLQEERKKKNKTKEWVVAEGDDYLLTHADNDDDIWTALRDNESSSDTDNE